MAAHSSLVVRKTNDVHVVEFVDSAMLEQAQIERVHQELKQLIDNAGHPRFIISFDGLNFVSSAMIGVVISLHKQIASHKGELRLTNIPPKVMEVFKITRIDKLVKIYPNTDKALHKF
ncbi:MAG: STAS domain-containing protein [Phycisphaera sp.]|nr:STAS domain-containing protein [Phycisphaera sp.]